MRCEQVQERLSEYLEGLLDHKNHTAVQSHLSSCSRCQAEAQTLAQGIRVVANLPSVEPPPGFSQKVMARIREETERPHLWQRLFLPMRIKIPIHALALLLVGGLAVYLYQANQLPPKADQKEMTRSVPSKSEPMSQQELKSPAAPSSASAGQRQKEADEVTAGTAATGKALRRGETASPESLAKRKMSDLKSAKAAAPMAPASAPVQAVQYELIFTPQKPLEGTKALAPKLEVLVKQVGGEYLQSEERADGLKRNLLLEPQTVWVVIPEDRYGQFKTELSALGKIESELKAEGAPSAPRSSSEAFSMLRIKLTIRSTEKP